MDCPPSAPDPSLVPFEPAAQRTLTLMGSVVQLVWVPERSARAGQAGADRPAFKRSPAARIIAQEAFWHGQGLVATPNRYPFARQQRILWADHPTRDPDLAFWATAGEWVDRNGGSGLLNNIGAAATIAHAHAHLVAERLPFLAGLSERPVVTDLIDLPPACELVAKDVPFCLLGVRGPAAERAQAMLQIAAARLTACWNVVFEPTTSWIVPRRVETPKPWFSKPLGAAELWGRWCYVSEQEFESATVEDLEQALQHATMPALD